MQFFSSRCFHGIVNATENSNIALLILFFLFFKGGGGKHLGTELFLLLEPILQLQGCKENKRSVYETDWKFYIL